jgi:RNA-splicing ligase RtcB
MIEVTGEYSDAKIFTDMIDETSLEQVKTLVDNPLSEGECIRMMPDIHAGNGCTIGTTMTVTDKIPPSLVGVDIGCGMHTVTLDTDEIDFTQLDEVIKERVPSGFNRRETPHKFIHRTSIDNLLCYDELRDPYGGGDLSLGTLGGGNHFIEVNQKSDGDFVLVIHSGSRNIGLSVCNYYQKQAKTEYLKEHKTKAPFYSVEGELFENYLHDMEIMQDFADWNRKAIVQSILSEYDLGVKSSFSTVHNYIDLDNMILRKGAVSACKGEKLLIPLNMRDGSIICKGKGNKDWNYSAPHGAGRIYGRREAKKKFSLTEFKESMSNVYSSCVNEDTLDESPFAYKPMDVILENIGDTVEIEEIIKPVYNFKAA